MHSKTEPLQQEANDVIIPETVSSEMNPPGSSCSLCPDKPQEGIDNEWIDARTNQLASVLTSEPIHIHSSYPKSVPTSHFQEQPVHDHSPEPPLVTAIPPSTLSVDRKKESNSTNPPTLSYEPLQPQLIYSDGC